MSTPLSPADLCVAPNGDDRGPGTVESPFATLTRAREAIRQRRAAAGDRDLPGPLTVWIRGGKYYLDQCLDLSEVDSGTATAPIAWIAYPGETPVLSGGRRLTDWRPYRDGILRTEVPQLRGTGLFPRQLYADGLRQVRARYPKADSTDPAWNGRWAHSRLDDAALQSSRPYLVWDEPDAFRTRWAKPTQGEVFLLPSQTLWGDSCLIRIQSVDPEAGVIRLAHGRRDFDVNPMFFHRRLNRPECCQFIVENLLEELTEPGEWCLDADEGVVYFRPPVGRRIEEMEVVIPLLKRLVHLEGVSHVHLAGLTFTEVRGGEPSSHYRDVEGVGAMAPQMDWEYSGEVIYLNRCTGCEIRACRIHHAGGNGIYLRNHNDRNRILGNALHDLGANGIAVAGSRLTIYDKVGGTPGTPHPVFTEIADNTIHHIGQVDTYAAGVFLGLSNWSRVIHNEIHDVPHHAINLGNSRYGRSYVERNRISRAGLVTSDNAAINCWHEVPPEVEPPGHVIRGNLITDTGNAAKAGVRHCTLCMGIYLDNWSSNCLVEGNVIVNTQPDGEGVAILVKGHNNLVENNVLVNSGRCHLFVCDHCCYEEFATVVARNIFYDSRRRGRPVFELARRDQPRQVLLHCDHNLYYQAGAEPLILEEVHLAAWQEWGKQGGDGYDGHAIAADPLFVDAARGDFRLRPESPALTLGFRAVAPEQAGVRQGW